MALNKPLTFDTVTENTTTRVHYLRLAIAVSSSSASVPLADVNREDVGISDCLPSEALSTLFMFVSSILLD